MAKVIKLRLTDPAYEAVRRHAEADEQSMKTWIEQLLSVEDMRRRARAHAQWLAAHPEAVACTESWADRAMDDFVAR